ncbi:MAG: ParB/Srx family N-terminal domain-containing protein [Paracoccaceae bacterium]
MAEARAPRIQYISTPEGLSEIAFSDGLAAVEVPFALLAHIPLVNEVRQPGPRLAAVLRSIRRWGYRPSEPIICRIGMKGRWVVLDGGHRITAARTVAREWWSNLCGPKVRTLYFLLYTTPGSWSKLPCPPG